MTKVAMRSESDLKLIPGRKGRKREGGVTDSDLTALLQTKKLSRIAVVIWQVAIGALFLGAWQFLPKVGWLARHFKFLNGFFISSPTRVASRIGDLLVGSGPSHISLWPYLSTTVVGAVVGVTIGIVLGACAGLICSNSRAVSDVARVFLVIANAIPRIALIPIFVVIYGATIRSSILSVVAIVFFLVFYNAFEGGQSVPPAVIENAILLGANRMSLMVTVRLPRVIAWTFAVVPNAIAFGIVAATTTELLTGIRGMGTLLQEALQNADSTLTFAVIVVLSVVGLVLYALAVRIQRFFTRWET